MHALCQRSKSDIGFQGETIAATTRARLFYNDHACGKCQRCKVTLLQHTTNGVWKNFFFFWKVRQKKKERTVVWFSPSWGTLFSKITTNLKAIIWSHTSATTQVPLLWSTSSPRQERSFIIWCLDLTMIYGLTKTKKRRRWRNVEMRGKFTWGETPSLKGCWGGGGRRVGWWYMRKEKIVSSPWKQGPRYFRVWRGLGNRPAPWQKNSFS